MEEKNLHRIFVAIDFPDNLIKEVARIQEILRNLKFTGKLTELENLHLTLKFLGEVDEEKLIIVREKLKEIRLNSFESGIDKIGTFSFRENPRIIWIKIAGKGIFELQKKIDTILSEIGFEKEQRFMSHMTIARIKYVKDKIRFKEYVNCIKLKKIKFKVDRFNLKESELREMGPVYSDLEIYELD